MLLLNHFNPCVKRLALRIGQRAGFRRQPVVQALRRAQECFSLVCIGRGFDRNRLSSYPINHSIALHIQYGFDPKLVHSACAGRRCCARIHGLARDGAAFA